MNRRTARIAERHRVRYPVVIRGVLEFRRIHAQSAGDREIGTRPPLILRIRAGIQNIERLDRLRLPRSEEHTSELQSRVDLVCRVLLEKKNNVFRLYTSTI